MIVALSDTSSLLRPLTERDVLVPDEQVYYAERQHWASVVQPAYETFIILLIVIWVADFRGGGPSPANAWITVILLCAAAHAVLLTLNGRRPPTSRLANDPFQHGPDAAGSPLVPWAIGGTLVLILVFAGFLLAAVATVFLVIARLTTILARWAFYERRYITNRRLIESSGFLGSRIASMPLSRVTDIVYGRSIPGEILGYAQMRVETAGQDQALGIVKFIAEPDHFYEVLVNFSAPRPATQKPETSKGDGGADGTLGA